MRKWISFFILLLLLLIHSSVAYAGSISNLSAAVDSSGKVVVSGAVSTGAGHAVNIMINNPNGDIDYIDSIVSGSQGSFTFSYTLAAKTAGKYTVTLNSEGVAAPITTSFSYGVNSDLKSLIISKGSFDQSFSPGVTDYTATLQSSADSITVTPTASDATAAITVNGTAVASGKASGLIPMKPGANIIKVAVKAPDGSSKTYSLTITRKQQSAVSITAAASIDAARNVEISGTVSSGAGQPISILIMDPKNNMEYAGQTVSTDGGAFKTVYTLQNTNKGKYTVMVSGIGITTPTAVSFDYGMDASLKNITLDSGKLSPAFSADVTSYTATVSYTVKKVTIQATAASSGAAVKINDLAAKTGGMSAAVPLEDGDNSVNITVTAEDGTTFRNYTLTVQKDANPSDKVSVKASIDSNKQVSVTGSVGVKGYPVSVMITDPGGKLEYADSTISGEAGSFRFAYTLSNTAVGKYNVTINSFGLSGPATTSFVYGDVSLKSLSVAGASISPRFDSNTMQYAASVEYEVTDIQVIPTAYSNDTQIKVNGTAVKSGSKSDAIALSIGSNTVRVVVSGQDGTTKTYTVSIQRERKAETTSSGGGHDSQSSDATLSGLGVGSGTLTPGFAAATTSYTVTVPNATSSITVTPTVNESHATVTVSGAAVTSGNASNPMSLTVGSNTINIVVTAQDNSTKTYTITVTRQAPSQLSSDATLSGLSVGSGSLSPTFAAGTASYTVTVANAISSITVTPTVNESHATVTVSGAAVTSGSASSPMSLTVGSNTISIVVTAQDSTTNTYTITVTRQAPAQLSSDATLSGLGVGSGSLTPGFASATAIYTVTVANATDSITVTPTANESHATVTVNGTPVASGSASDPISLTVGDNTISIVVTAQDSTTNTYTITVTRQHDSSLTSLGVNLWYTGDNGTVPLTISWTFSPGTTEYDLYPTFGSTPTTTTSIDVTPTASEQNSTITVNGNTVGSGNTYSGNLAAGQDIVVVVTAEDNTLTTYTLRLHY